MVAGCPPGSDEGCYERDGEYFIKDENGNESSYDPIPIRISTWTIGSLFAGTLIYPSLAGGGIATGEVVGGGFIAANPVGVGIATGIVFSFGTIGLHAYLSQGNTRPMRENSSTNLGNTSVIAISPTKNCACSVPVLMMAKSREQKMIEFIAKEAGVSYDDLSDEIHREKESVGRGGADNLGKAKIKQIAKELADRLGVNK